MASVQPLRSSKSTICSICLGTQASYRAISLRLISRPRRTYASATAPPPGKQIVLEQPDKFRPPSHPQRLVKGRGRGNTFGSGYNQRSSLKEQAEQKTKRYPHTFPNEGTVMHKVLTNRKWHVFFTMGTLALLAALTSFTTFSKTSPFAKMLPPLSSLLFHPITFVKDCYSVFRLDLDYKTSQAAEARAQNLLDTQKRRIYRRAHGMENLDAESDQGIDVRGIVPWDDGLTNRERANRRADATRKGDVPVDMTTATLAEEEAVTGEEGVEPEEVKEEPKGRKRVQIFGIW